MWRVLPLSIRHPNRYAVAFVILGALFFIRSGVSIFVETPTTFSLFVLAVLLSAWYGGWGPGFLVTVLGAALNLMFFLKPFGVGGYEHYVLSAIFLLEGGIVSILGETRLRASKARREFIATASHDLKNPLAAIVSYAQLIERMAEKQGRQTKEADYAYRIRSEANLAVSLINDLSDLARSELARLRFDRQEFDLKPVIEEAVAAQNAISQTHTVRLTRTTSFIMYADRGRIRQVFDNIIGNAVKYSPGEREVLVSLTVVGREARVEVRDFGIGLAPTEKQHIFKRFYRTVSAARSGIQGSGLGLSIARQIVEYHGGTISVTAAPGRGTVFTVCLPKNQLG